MESFCANFISPYIFKLKHNWKCICYYIGNTKYTQFSNVLQKWVLYYIKKTFIFLSRTLKNKPWLKEQCYQIPHAMLFRHGLWLAHDEKCEAWRWLQLQWEGRGGCHTVNYSTWLIHICLQSLSPSANLSKYTVCVQKHDNCTVHSIENSQV
jgi:hypothetical protein